VRAVVNDRAIQIHVDGVSKPYFEQVLAMRKLSRVLASIVIVISTMASANDELADGKQMIKDEREHIVRAELHLTDDEAAAFWPLYAEYRQEHNEIMERYGSLIAEYVRRYDDADLTNEYADEMIASYFEVKTGLLKTQQDYLPKFRAFLPAMKVARFYQLENKINVEIDAQIADVVPLVDPS
jgi:hypothetical protein